MLLICLHPPERGLDGDYRRAGVKGINGGRGQEITGVTLPENGENPERLPEHQK